MSIRDIIEKWHLISANYAQHGYTAAVHARDFEEMRDDFASALEELSLMEAVCEAAERVVEAARYCCIALSDDGTSIDLCIQTGERDGEPLYAFVDEVDQWQNAERLLLALTDYDAAFAMATVTASRLEAERGALLALLAERDEC